MPSSSASAGSSGGRMPGRRAASIDLPAPGGPTISKLWLILPLIELCVRATWVGKGQHVPHFNFPPDVTGYSLVRFSRKQQADGDSYRRQVAAAETFCREEQIPLDMSLHEADIRKLGMLAFTGRMWSKARSGSFSPESRAAS